MHLYLIFGLSALLIVLGFIALLAQKNYLDANTGTPTEIEVPFFGRIKANYPALCFVFLGCCLAFVAFSKSYPPAKVEWVLTGSVKHPQNTPVDWREGSLIVNPSDIYVELTEGGTFTLHAWIDEGKTIEEVYDRLDISHRIGNAKIALKQEHERYSHGGSTTLIQNIAGHTWNFKPIQVELALPEEKK